MKKYKIALDDDLANYYALLAKAQNVSVEKILEDTLFNIASRVVHKMAAIIDPCE